MARVALLAVVPSPYQRDLLTALVETGRQEMRVFYLETAAPDSPWPEEPLRPWERVLPGGAIRFGATRFHCNLPLPQPRDYDLLVLNNFMSTPAQFLMRQRSVPWVFWGERLPRQGGLHNFLRGALVAPMKRSAGIAAIGSLARSDYQARWPHSRVFNIPYHTDLAAFARARASRPPASAFVFLFCGQMIRRKGVDLLLAAFERLAREHRDCRLLLVGREADLPRLLSEIDGKARARIDYLGFRAPADLPEIFARAHCFVLPSRHDGWGVVVNQAIGAGLPLICSDAVGASHDLLSPERNGLRIPSGSVDALAAAMRRLLSAPEEAARFGECSAALAGDWTPARGAQRWVEAIDEILHRP